MHGLRDDLLGCCCCDCRYVTRDLSGARGKKVLPVDGRPHIQKCPVREFFLPAEEERKRDEIGFQSSQAIA